MIRRTVVALLAATAAGCASERADPAAPTTAQPTTAQPTTAVAPSEGTPSTSPAPSTAALMPVVTAPISELLRHIPASADPVTARVRSLRAIGSAAGIAVPELDASRDDWYEWRQVVRCCAGLDPIIPSPGDQPAEFAEASGWSVRDFDSVATANVGGAPMPVVARGEFRVAVIQSLVGGRPGEVVTLGTPGQFDLEARSPLRPQGQSVSFVYDDALLIAGYQPDDVAAASAGESPLAERDDVVEALGVIGDAVDDLIIQTGGSYFAAAQFLLCLPRCQEAFDVVVEAGLPAVFRSLVIGHDHDERQATLVWVHADARAAEKNADRLPELLARGVLDSAGVRYETVLMDPSIEVRGRLLIVTATVDPQRLGALVADAGESVGIFGHQVMDPVAAA